MNARGFVWATLAILGAPAAASATAPTLIYDVTIKDNSGKKFSDCFTFHLGTLTIAGLPGYILKYTPAPAPDARFYQATPTTASVTAYNYSVAFAVFKMVGSLGGSIRAIGADEIHNSYSIEGVAVSACSAADNIPAFTNWWPPAR